MSEVGNVTVNFNANIAPIQEQIRRLQAQMRQFGGNIQNNTSQITGLSSAFTKMAAVTAVVVGVYQSLKLLINAAVEGIKVYNQFNSANVGLKSILDAQGKSFSGAKTFIDAYIKDGLIPLADAVTAYKQLTQRGYNDEQVKNTLTRLKDSAAFGRQSSLSIGEAVRSATEGLKNENSILVDNAGVTKNVSVMWAEYAKSIGKGANSLSKQQKIQAEVNGIMKETSFQVGDAAKYAGTLGGQLSALNAKILNLKNAFGAALAPALERILPVIANIIVAFTDALNVVGQFTRELFGIKESGKAASKAEKELGDSTAKAASKAKNGIAAFDEINSLQESIAKNAEDAADAVGSTDTTTPTGGNESSITPKWIKDLVADLKDKLGPSLDKVNVAWDAFKKAVAGIVENPVIKKIIEFMGSSIVSAASAGLELLASALDTITGAIKLFDGITTLNAQKMLEGLGTIISGLGKTLVTFLAGGLNLIPGFRENLDKVGEAIKNGITHLGDKGGTIDLAWKTISNLAVSAWDTVTEPKTGIGAKITAIKDKIVEGIDTAKGFIKTAWGKITSIAISIWDTVLNVKTGVAAKIAAIKDVIVEKVGLVLTPVKNAWKTIINGALEVWDIITNPKLGVAKKIAAIKDVIVEKLGLLVTPLKTVWDKITSPITKFWDGLESVISKSINKVKEFINKFIDGYNKIKISIPVVNLPIVGKVGGGVIGVPQIPRLARGAIINSPTLAQVGEAGTEAIVPLENTSFVDKLSSALGNAVLSAMQFNNSNNQTSSGGDMILQIDSTKIARVIMPALIKENNRIGNRTILSTI
jgi:hypothetical protein